MSKTPGRPLSPLAEDSGLVVGGVLAHVMDKSTVDSPPPTSTLDYLHFLKLFQFLYLTLHYLLYLLGILHFHSVVPLDKYLRPGHIQQARKLIIMGENGSRKIMVLNKTSTVLINSATGS